MCPVQFSLLPHEDSRGKVVKLCFTVSGSQQEQSGFNEGLNVRSLFTCRGLVSAGDEEEEAALPTASDEGQAEPCDSSLWC